jgi:hypothetical protein
MFGRGRINLVNMMRMKVMDKRLTSLMPVEDMGEWASDTMHFF